MQHAERAASSLIKDVLSAQAKGRERHEKFEKEQSTREEMREKCGEKIEYMDLQVSQASYPPMYPYMGPPLTPVPATTVTTPATTVSASIPPTSTEGSAHEDED